MPSPLGTAPAPTTSSPERAWAKAGGRSRPPAPIVRATENLETALRLRLKEGPIDEASADTIAAALDAAARAVEKSR